MMMMMMSSPAISLLLLVHVGYLGVREGKSDCFQCFDAVDWTTGRTSGLPIKLTGGMLAWLSGNGMRCRLAYCPADATATHYLLLQ